MEIQRLGDARSPTARGTRSQGRRQTSRDTRAPRPPGQGREGQRFACRSASHNRTIIGGNSEGPSRQGIGRSEEHTSELQSQSNLVCRLLLEKKKYITRGVQLQGSRIEKDAGGERCNLS